MWSLPETDDDSGTNESFDHNHFDDFSENIFLVWATSFHGLMCNLLTSLGFIWRFFFLVFGQLVPIFPASRMAWKSWSVTNGHPPSGRLVSSSSPHQPPLSNSSSSCATVLRLITLSVTIAIIVIFKNSSHADRSVSHCHHHHSGNPHPDRFSPNQMLDLMAIWLTSDDHISNFTIGLVNGQCSWVHRSWTKSLLLKGNLWSRVI